MSESVTVDQFLEMARRKMMDIDDTKLFYTLRKFGVNIRVNADTFRAMKAAIALHDLGITEFGTRMIMAVITPKFDSIICSRMHILGDNHVIVKLRGIDSGMGVWQLSKPFLDEWTR
jgi:hypothetical protein